MTTFATWNPSDKHANISLSGSDLIAAASSGWAAVRGTIFRNDGKWCAEVVLGGTYGGAGYVMPGIATSSANLGSYIGSDAYGYGFHGGIPCYYYNGGQYGWGLGVSSGDKIMIAVDYDNLLLWFGKNGTWFQSGDPANGTNGITIASGSYALAVSIYSADATATLHAMDDITFAIPDGFYQGYSDYVIFFCHSGRH